MSIYKGTTKVCGTGVQLDNTLNADSNNAVTNATITNALEDVGYDTWVKPADWVDIRSGALDNSVYFLVGHAVDYSKYPEFQIKATISNSGTYDVYIDGLKQFTTESGTTTIINWQTLALTSGYDTTYPETLRTHIIRLTPSISTNTITAINTEGTNVQLGLLWAHFQISNYIGLNYFLGNSNGSKYCPICEAVTASEDIINIQGNLNYCFRGAQNLQKVPTINGNNTSREASNCFYNTLKIKKIHLKNIKLFGVYTFTNSGLLKKIECENAFVQYTDRVFDGCSELKELPASKSNISVLGFLKNVTNLLQGCSSLNPTFLDFTEYNNNGKITLGGSSAIRLNVKGMVVSNQGPFDATTAPQLDVSYTGLDRNALVTLFKSMPTVSASQVCTITGATGANDLTAADLAIATNKGWTITR